MARYGPANSRNHGYGKHMEYAGEGVLRDRYLGHFKRVSVHKSNWKDFCQYAREHEDVRDMRKVDAALVQRYAHYSLERGLALGTVHDRISTLNVILGHANPRWCRLSPSTLTGQKRSQVRTVPPASAEAVRVETAVVQLEAAGLERIAAVVLLAYWLGLRVKETLLADLDEWNRQYRRYGRINVTRGTKGGRRAPRWIAIGAPQLRALEYALRVRPEGSRNLLRREELLKGMLARDIKRGRRILKACELPDYRDLRAGFSCRRYRQETGYAAPVIAAAQGLPMAPASVDRAARAVLVLELGHVRISIGVSYYGRSVRCGKILALQQVSA